MNDDTVIVGMGYFKKIEFSARGPLYWKPSLGEKGYCSIDWNDDGSIKDRFYILGTGNEEQAGVSLDEIVRRDPINWAWLSSDVSISTAPRSFFMNDTLFRILGQLGADFGPYQRERNDRGIFGFGTIDEIKQKAGTFYQVILKETDRKLADCFRGGDFWAAKALVPLLVALSYDSEKDEGLYLRSALLEHLAKWQRLCNLLAGHFDSFSNPETLERALKQLKQEILEQNP
jgi:hypothetical protein